MVLCSLLNCATYILARLAIFERNFFWWTLVLSRFSLFYFFPDMILLLDRAWHYCGPIATFMIFLSSRWLANTISLLKCFLLGNHIFAQYFFISFCHWSTIHLSNLALETFELLQSLSFFVGHISQHLFCEFTWSTHHVCFSKSCFFGQILLRSNIYRDSFWQ